MTNQNPKASGEPVGRIYTIGLAMIRGIDRFSDAIGQSMIFLFIPLVLSNVIEVVMRYFLNSPTSWAGEVTAMSNGTLFMLGAGYALLKGAHIRTDIYWEDFSNKTKGMIDLVTYVVMFLPIMGVIFYMSVDDFLYAYSINERSNMGLWQPIIWPFRGVIPLAALLLFIQGISELLKAFWLVKTGVELVHHEKIDI